MLRTEFITGPAGTGKTFLVKGRAEEPGWGTLSATTGIAGVNMGTQTLHSLLAYFDTASLRDNYVTGRLHRMLRAVYARSCNLVIDEVSMLSGEQLSLIVDAADALAEQRDLGLVLTGDMCQLPPIKEPWVFASEHWPRFEENTTRLTKHWRQADPRFLEALQHAREGDGEAAANGLKDLVEWRGALDLDFEGTTILPKNAQVDRYNQQRLAGLASPFIRSERDVWGSSSGEWKLIPKTLELREGCLVMILSNDRPDFTYANGDLGWVEGWKLPQGVGGEPGEFCIRLCRNNAIVCIPRIYRLTTRDDAPHDGTMQRFKEEEGKGRPRKVHYDVKLRKYVTGWVRFHPLRVAYAATCHKVQGLSLDRVQLDVRDGFFGTNGMAYVGLSRARTPEGLKIVGTPEVLAKRVKVAEEVRRWA